MKLKLKHIAPYLPYKLKAKFPETNKKGCRRYVVGIISALYDDCTIVCHETVNASPDKFKPLMIPLSNFKEYDSKHFIDLNCDMEQQVEIFDLANHNIHYSDLTVKAYEICLINHIDIFNLIPNNLAVAL